MNERQVYLTDDWTLQDYLYFSDFRPALQRILLQANTPLTVGVFGPWGSGKTSLMRMLYDEIEQKGLAYLRAVWFTAWKYDQEDSLWRAFMLRVIDRLYPREDEPASQPREKRPRLIHPTDARQRAQIETLERLEASIYRPVDWQEMGRWMIDWAGMGKSGAKMGMELAKLFLPGAGFVEKLFGAANLDDQAQGALRREMQTYHRQQLVEREQFERSFAEAIELILGQDGEKGRLVVFVDDLDRCLPEKAVEVLEAIKLFLSVPGTVFVLGMDREVIERGIETRYRAYFQPQEEEHKELPIEGSAYLQKLVQIPFHLPPLSAANLAAFIANLENEGGLRLSQMTRQVFAHGLLPNPRQVKRALNIFRLLREIADQRSQSRDETGALRLGADAVANPLLAKTIVIQTQYPKLYQDWRRYPTLVRTLEEQLRQQPSSEVEHQLGWVRGKRVAASEAGTGGETPGTESRSGGLLEKYLANRQKYALLEQMLRYPDTETMVDAETGEPCYFSGLDAAQMAVYVHLAGAVAPEPPAVEQGSDLQADLLSNDWAKIKDALERLPDAQKQNPQRLRQQLIQVVENEAAPSPERASAGYALGLLGDTRPGVLSREPLMVPIVSPLRFLMGEAKDEAIIAAPYAISKYPITNAQYRYFVEDSGYRKKKWLERCWTADGRVYLQKYNWTAPRFSDDPILSLGNLPVVGVSWYEAAAYAAWLAAITGQPYRLPTEAEWERAARYTDGRLYPWGDEWREGIINSKEADLRRLTAVGIFANSHSQEGVADLSGNVWEWCQTRWQDEKGQEYPLPYRADDGREELRGDKNVVRVLRGGSWYSDAVAARCGARVRYDPRLRYYNYGFRVVLSPFTADR